MNLNEKTLSSLEKLTSIISKQQYKNYIQKLDHLKLKNNIPMDVPNMNMHTYPSKTRRFVPRRKYHKWKKIESTKRNLDLIQ